MMHTQATLEETVRRRSRNQTMQGPVFRNRWEEEEKREEEEEGGRKKGTVTIIFFSAAGLHAF